MRTVIKHQNEGEFLAVIEGKLAADEALPLIAELTNLAGKAEKLVIDIRGLEYINAAGVRALLKIRKAIMDQGGVVLLTHPAELVQRIFNIFKFDNLFQFVQSDLIADPDAEVAA